MRVIDDDERMAMCRGNILKALEIVEAIRIAVKDNILNNRDAAVNELEEAKMALRLAYRESFGDDEQELKVVPGGEEFRTAIDDGIN